MGIMNRALVHAKRMLARLPAYDLILLRPTVNEFGEPNGLAPITGSFRAWRFQKSPIKKDTHDLIYESGTNTLDDNGFYLAMPHDTAPQAQHGDMVMIDSRYYRVNEVFDRESILVYWRVSERSEPDAPTVHDPSEDY